MHSSIRSHGDEERARRGSSEQSESEGDAAAPLSVVVDRRPTVGSVGLQAKGFTRRGRGSPTRMHGLTMIKYDLDNELAITRARVIPGGMRNTA